MAKRGSGVDFHEGLKRFRANLAADLTSTEPISGDDNSKPEFASPSERPHNRPPPVPFRQSPTQAVKKAAVSTPKSKLNKPAARLGPTNLPPSTGKFSYGAISAPRRPNAAPIGPTTPADLPGPEAMKYVAATVDLTAMRSTAAFPTFVTEDEELSIQSCVQTGAGRLRQCSVPDETGFLVGFDFGTSSSKIVIHQPGAQNLAYALSVPQTLRAVEQGASQDHLWRSIVWYDANSGRFELYPSGGSTPVEGFKTGLIQSSGHRMMVGGVTHTQAATAYLAMLIAYVIGHHYRSAPQGFDRSTQFSRFHFGIPVACKDELGCADEFKRVLAAAFRLAPLADTLDLSMVKEVLKTATADDAISSETPFLLFEELAGVIAGYRASPDHRTGPHVIVDVGASTLDIATFHIPEGDHKILVFMSAVGLLGAEALRTARRVDVPDKTFRSACAHQTDHVLQFTRQRKDIDFQYENGIPKPLLFVGGGRLTDVHNPLYKNYSNALEAPRRTPEPGANLSYDRNTDFARLLLSWGLAQEDLDLPLIKPPSEIEDEVRRHHDYRDKYVDKDMC